MLKPLTVWITTKCGKFLERWNTKTPYLVSWEICMQVKKQQIEQDMEQQSGSRLGKEYIKAVVLVLTVASWPAYRFVTCLFNLYAENIIKKYQAGWLISWNQECHKKYLPLQICWWHHPNGRKWRGTKEPLDEGERGEWKSWLKTQLSRNWDHGISSHHFMANIWEEGKNGNSDRIYFGGVPKSLWMATAALN